MTPSQRIALNTAATYGRSIITIGLALFSSRWVLNALGQTDFGLFSLVGSIIILITFLNQVMANSVSRHFAYAIGQSDSAEVKKWFNVALSIHICFAVALIPIGWPIGEYLIRHVLTIPPDRIHTCIWVFRASLVSALVSVVAVPFIGMFTAEQRISEMAIWGTLQSGLTFVLAYVLMRLSGDLLLIYAIGTVVIISLIQAAQIVRAFYIFQACRIAFDNWFNTYRLKRIGSFAVWNMIGYLGATLRDQGSAILVNLYFGPTVNAAYGIGKQVSTQTIQLSASMMGAFSPEITASEGRGDRTRMLLLSLRASKLGTILVLLFAVPLTIDMDYVIKLWLHVPPSYTAMYCRLIIMTFAIDRLTSAYMLAANAHGKIAIYQATVGISMLMTLPLAWLLVKVGCSPTSVGVAFVTTMIASSVGRVIWGKRLLGVPVRRWFLEVVWPSVITGVVASIAGLFPYCLMRPSFGRLMTVTVTSMVIFLLATWFFAFDRHERAFCGRNLKRAYSRLSVLCGGACQTTQNTQ